MDSAEWDRYFAVNVRGMMECVKVVVPIMRRRKYGKIINIENSGTVWNGPPMMLQYVSTKGAILSMTRALSTELGKDGIRVNAIAPGLTSTDYIKGKERLLATISRRWRRRARCNARKCPRMLVGPCIFLASPDSDFVTGQCIVVDGGAIKH